MKPSNFEYAAPDTLEQTVATLAAYREDAKLMAGGQSLVPLLSSRLLKPRIVVDITRVSELRYLERREGGVSVGAIVRQVDAEDSPILQANCPLLGEALRSVGHPQIRSQGTVVGNLVANNPAGELPVVAVALGAKFTVVGPGRRTTVDAEDFLGVSRTTSLRPDEVAVDAWFPAQEPGTGWAFLEVTLRHGHLALVGVAVTLKLGADGVVTDACVGLAGVSDRPVRSRAAEAALVGQPATRDVFVRAGEAAAGDDALRPPDGSPALARYRRTVAPVLVERALEKAKARIPNGTD